MKVQLLKVQKLKIADKFHWLQNKFYFVLFYPFLFIGFFKDMPMII